MKIAVFGAGYVGLVTAACFADIGNEVVVVDIDPNRLALLNSGKSPIFEPGLSELLEHNLAHKRLIFTSNPAEISDAEAIFIAVGTPPRDDGSVDMQYVYQVAQTIGEHLTQYAVVVDKSTVPVGTAQKVSEIIAEVLKKRGAAIEFDVVSNPEFLKEGAAINDFMRPDRIVIGSSSPKAIEKMRLLYAPYNRNHERMMIMDERSAELTKYAANAMLATKISFMNEMSRIAEAVGADIEMVRLGIGADHRIGYHFIYPGCGYGGSCFPKDVKAIIHFSQESGHTPKILNAVEEVNFAQKQVLFEKIKTYFKDLQDKTIAVWGLAFKPNTDDIRDASSRVLIEALLKAGAKIKAYDPEAVANFNKAYPNANIEYVHEADDALIGADALAIVTEWREFKSPDFQKIKNTLKHPVIFDGRNLFDPALLKSHGLHYYGIGRLN